MSLDYAILGFLNYQPLSGYDLKKVFDDSVRHFWYADQSQIYRTLNRLYEEKWVEQEIVEQEDRPDRKVYHITQAGREALRAWLVAPPEPEAPHSAPLIKVFFAGQYKNEQLVELFQHMSGMMEHVLKNYEEVPQKIEAYRPLANSDREIYFWRSTLDLGIRVAKVQQEWAQDIVNDLENGRVPEK